MIKARELLTDLQAVQKRLEQDLRQQIAESAELKQSLEADYQAAQEAVRTAETFNTWSDAQLTQASVAWLLACAFLRFCEDNRLIPEPLLAGPGDANRRVRERAREYFSAHPTENERHYLEHCFRNLAEYPAMAALYDPAHNPLSRLPLSWEAARNLVAFWQRVDPDSGELVHNFADPDLNTRFLGDLYQDLSEAARKRYALLQTPEFVEEFILERTLEPAIKTFGLDEVRLIDPTCGSGHFLLGAFLRLLEHWQHEAPGLDIRERVKRAVSAVYGVDLNPFAVAIARFRLLVAALAATNIRSLKEAPGWRFNVTAGDSLLHGRRFGELDLSEVCMEEQFGHYYGAEDPDEVRRILGKQYHAVVGNPPYITVKDKALNQLYRARHQSCHMKYSLGVPFTERFFQLTLSEPGQPAGYLGLISTNSFMKREFGKKLIEEYLPHQDVTHVIDTSGAYIPGHGTPTVILFARHRRPVKEIVRAVLGIRGEPGTPDDPAHGFVWASIVEFIDQPGIANEYVSAEDISRALFCRHPWSLQGGAAPSVLRAIELGCQLKSVVDNIGITAVTGADEVLVLQDESLANRLGIRQIRKYVLGELVRDWCLGNRIAVWPHAEDFSPLPQDSIGRLSHHLWRFRSVLNKRKRFGTLMSEKGLTWYEFQELYADKLAHDFIITFAFVATHNHFVLDRGGKVFNRTAPVIKLPAYADEKDHLGLLGLLNSSTGCFWLKQICFNKGMGDEHWADRFEHDGGKVGQFPLITERPIRISTMLDQIGQKREESLPASLRGLFPLAREELDDARANANSLLKQMIAWQDELDWWCYRAYGLCDEDLTYSEVPPEAQLGERAFEIVLARKLAAGEIQTSWFKRHGSKPITEVPEHWPDDYRALVEHRIDLIETSPWIGLLERSEYKRRWNQPSWESLELAALKDWLLERLETNRYWPEPLTRSLDELTAVAERDRDFMAVARQYTREAGFDVRALMGVLLEESTVPAVRVLRYKDSGLRKRADWEETWELQRQEDAIDAQVEAGMKRDSEEDEEEWQARLKKTQDNRKQAEIGVIPVPPKYKSSDFLATSFWRLRGALDVAKERFFSLPAADGEWIYGWAGWDSAERVQAVFGAYSDAASRKGWEVEQLIPLLAAIDEELPWVLQWHNEIHPEYDVRLGDYFREQLGQELHKHGLTAEDLHQWKPAANKRARRRSAAT